MNRVVDMFEKDGWAIASKESLLSLGSVLKLTFLKVSSSTKKILNV